MTRETTPATDATQPAAAAALDRRRFLGALAALSGGLAGLPAVCRAAPDPASAPADREIIACDKGPTDNGDFLFDPENWRRHGMAHLINAFWPGDHGAVAFRGDASPFDARLPQQSPGVDPIDESPGAYAACAIDALFDPYYTLAGSGGPTTLVSELDWWARLAACGGSFYFHDATLPAQIASNHGVEQTDLGPLFALWQGAWQITMSAAFGASFNYKVTRDIGWPGPADGYYHGTASGSHLGDWLRPLTVTADGNLP